MLFTVYLWLAGLSQGATAQTCKGKIKQNLQSGKSETGKKGDWDRIILLVSACAKHLKHLKSQWSKFTDFLHQFVHQYSYILDFVSVTANWGRLQHTL